MLIEELTRTVDAYQPKIETYLAKLIEIDTTNPPGNEYRLVAFLKKLLEKQHIKYTTLEARKGRTNLIARVGRGRPKVMVACHSDVVPAGSGWKTPPFKAVKRKGKIYGRGTEDNKGAIAASLVVLEALKAHERELQGTFQLAVFADEEQGSKLGAEYCLNRMRAQSRPDFAIVPDTCAGLGVLSIGEKALLELKLEFHGKQAHASEPHLGKNAINAMVEFLFKFESIKLPGSISKLFTPTSKNVGVISGGVAPNVVPGSCSALIDLRLPPEVKKQKVTRVVRELAKKVAERRKVSFKLQEIMFQRAFVLSRENTYIRYLCHAAKDVLGKAPRYVGVSGTTVAKKFIEHRIPAVGFGPGERTAHKQNEYVKAGELHQFAKILIRFCARSLTKQT